jgi:hypothetical protein
MSATTGGPARPEGCPRPSQSAACVPRMPAATCPTRSQTTAAAYRSSRCRDCGRPRHHRDRLAAITGPTVPLLAGLKGSSFQRVLPRATARAETGADLGKWISKTIVFLGRDRSMRIPVEGAYFPGLFACPAIFPDRRATLTAADGAGICFAFPAKPVTAAPSSARTAW